MISKRQLVGAVTAVCKLSFAFLKYKIFILEIVFARWPERISVHLIEKLDDFKAAFIYIKMNIAFFKIGSYQTPDFGIGIPFFQTLPDLKSKSLSMFIRINIKQIQPIDSRLIVNPDNDTSNFFPISIYGQRFTLRVV